MAMISANVAKLIESLESQVRSLQVTIQERDEEIRDLKEGAKVDKKLVTRKSFHDKD